MRWVVKWQLFGILILIFGDLVGDEEDLINLSNDSGPVFVSLGCNCDVAEEMRNNQLRKGAFPFDWLCTFNPDSIKDLLDDDFQFFLDKQCLLQYPIPINSNQAVNLYYDIEFTHDNLPLDRWEEWEVQSTLSKFERRINRFRNLRQYPGKVIFIRSSYNFKSFGMSHFQKEWWVMPTKKISSKQIQELKNALDRYFPDLDFILVMVNYTEESLLPEEIPGVLEFKMNRYYRVDYYREMFKTLNLSQ